jgi:hypothetical protein
MLIATKNGRVLYESRGQSVREALEFCALHGVDLSGADLRRHKLSGARLDGLLAREADFWGCDLCGADMAAGDFEGADFRGCDLSDVCFAGSNLKNAAMMGVYFSKTMFEDAVLDGIHVSCPSFFGCEIAGAASAKAMRYTHLGEVDINLHGAPIVLHGFSQRCVFLGREYILWGSSLYPQNLLPREARRIFAYWGLRLMQSAKILKPQNANDPMPKIPDAQARS